MTDELVWAKVTRPRVPLVYLDLHVSIYIARLLNGDDTVPVAYGELYRAALRAKQDKRAVFPLSGEHFWEIAKITDPKQRGDVSDVLEAFSDYNYLAGRPVIAELEMEAGMAAVLGQDISDRSIPLVRPTFGHAFGMVGGLKVVNEDGSDGSDAVRSGMADTAFEELMARMNYQAERLMLRGPSDQDLARLKKDPQFRPEVALEGQVSRLGWELETKRLLDEDPKWRRGRLRDVIAAREFAHEWLNMFTRMRSERPEFDPDDEQMRRFLGSMPHTQVAVSLKTQIHRNPQHQWTVNDLVDIDAASVAFPYCDAIFPDKALRHALLASKELRAFRTYVPRRPEELTEWLNVLPPFAAPDFLVPHPVAHPARPNE